MVPESDGVGEFGEGRGYPMPRVDIDTEFVVTAAKVLDESVPSTDHPCRAQPFQPRIGRSRAFGRPWSASRALFAYCSVIWHAAGSSSSITRG